MSEFHKRSFSYIGYKFVVAIGGDKGRDRMVVGYQLSKMGLVPMTLVNPWSFVAGTARIDEGCQIMAGASICELVRIGRHSIINTNASVDHECKIGSGVHVMPGATICGLVRLGDMVTIGSNATIFPRVEIGEGSIIGAGTVITKNIPANVIVHHKQDLTMRPVS